MDKAQNNDTFFKLTEQFDRMPQSETGLRIASMANDAFLREVLKDQLLGSLGENFASDDEDRAAYHDVARDATALLEEVVRRLQAEFRLNDVEAQSAVETCRMSINLEEIF